MSAMTLTANAEPPEFPWVIVMLLGIVYLTYVLQ